MIYYNEETNVCDFVGGEKVIAVELMYCLATLGIKISKEGYQYKHVLQTIVDSAEELIKRYEEKSLDEAIDKLPKED